jgi:hypothetical protein
VVDGEGVASVADRDHLPHTAVAPLPLVGARACRWLVPVTSASPQAGARRTADLSAPPTGVEVSVRSVVGWTLRWDSR